MYKYKSAIGIYLAIFFLYSNVACAQNATDYKVSTPYPVVDATVKLYASHEEKKLVIGAKFEGTNIILQTFNAATMQAKDVRTIKGLPKDILAEELLWLRDNLYLFFVIRNKKKKIDELFAYKIDYDNCDIIGKPKLVVSPGGNIQGKAMSGFARKYFSDQYQFDLSQDKSKLLIQYLREPLYVKDSRNKDVIGLSVFDEDLNKSDFCEFKMPYSEVDMDILDQTINSDGIPYVLIRVVKDNNYHNELLKINMNERNYSEFKIEAKSHYLRTAGIQEGIDKNILMSGYYNTKKSSWDWKDASSNENIEGVFLYNLNYDGKVQNYNFHEIPLMVLNQYAFKSERNRNNRKEKKDKANMSDLDLEILEQSEDGSALIVGQRFYVNTFFTQNRRDVEFVYRDILVAKINSNGELAWMRKIPKFQKAGSIINGLGFKYLSLGNQHQFIFLDNERNQNIDVDSRPAMHMDGRGGFLTSYQIDDQSGQVYRHSLFDITEMKNGISGHQFSPSRILKISESEFMIELYKKKKEDVMVKVIME